MIDRETYRKIKGMDRKEMDDFLKQVANMPDMYEAAAAATKMKAIECLEKAINIKGIGEVRKALIRENFKKEMEK